MGDEVGAKARPMARARTMMIRAAADLLQRRGYHGAGVAEILAQSGAPRGSLYHHFPGGKRQIVVEAIDYSARRFARDIESAGITDGLDHFVSALIALSKRDLVATDYASGCPIAAVSLDVPHEEREILDRCAAGFEHWASAVAAGMVARGLDAEQSDGLGRLFVRLMLGATMTARAQRDVTAIDEAGAHFAQMTLGAAKVDEKLAR